MDEIAELRARLREHEKANAAARLQIAAGLMYKSEGPKHIALERAAELLLAVMETKHD